MVPTDPVNLNVTGLLQTPQEEWGQRRRGGEGRHPFEHVEVAGAARRRLVPRLPLLQEQRFARRLSPCGMSGLTRLSYQTHHLR